MRPRVIGATDAHEISRPVLRRALLHTLFIEYWVLLRQIERDEAKVTLSVRILLKMFAANGE